MTDLNAGVSLSEKMFSLIFDKLGEGLSANLVNMDFYQASGDLKAGTFTLTAKFSEVAEQPEA